MGKWKFDSDKNDGWNKTTNNRTKIWRLWRRGKKCRQQRKSNGSWAGPNSPIAVLSIVMTFRRSFKDLSGCVSCARMEKEEQRHRCFVSPAPVGTSTPDPSPRGQGGGLCLLPSLPGSDWGLHLKPYPHTPLLEHKSTSLDGRLGQPPSLAFMRMEEAACGLQIGYK